MNASELLTYLQRREVTFRVDGDELHLSAPDGLLTATLQTALSEHKAEIVSILNTDDSGEVCPTPQGLPEDKPTLSYAQHQMWLFNQLEPDSPIYNIPVAFNMSGPLDIEALKQSLNELTQRHDILRTICSKREGEVIPTISSASFILKVINLQGYSASTINTEIRHILENEGRKPFCLTRDPPFRGTLLKIQKEECILLLTTHYFAVDGWSMGILYRELSSLYEACMAGNSSQMVKPSSQYGDYTFWQRKQSQQGFWEKQCNYWKTQLANFPPLPMIPADHERPFLPTFRGAKQTFSLPQSLLKALNELSRREGTTLFITLTAAIKTLLLRLTKQEDCVIGTTVSNRSRMEFEGLIGPCGNNLVLRTDLSGNPTFRELMKRVHRVCTGAYTNQEFPHELLRQELLLERDFHQSQLFQLLFILHQQSQVHTLSLKNLQVDRLPLDTGVTKLDMSLTMHASESELSGVLTYNASIFEPDSITRMLQWFQTLLESVVADHGQHLLDLSIMTMEQEQALTSHSAGGRSTVSSNLGSPQAFVTKSGEQSGLEINSRGVQSVGMEHTVCLPRDAIEMQLIKMWEKILNVQPVGIKDNFFRLGGSSIHAVQLFIQINELRGEDFPLALLFQLPTIEQLANAIRKEGWQSNWSSLVPIQVQGTRPPFFCVHGWGGNVLNYYSLTNHLHREQPFYGIQSVGLDGSAEPYETIEDMAAHYIREISMAVPYGPICVGGLSFGGLVAFEMARQLHNLGRKVVLVALFDTKVKNTTHVAKKSSINNRVRSFIQRTQYHFRQLLALHPRQKLGYIWRKGHTLKRRFKSRLWQTAYRVYLRTDQPLPAVLKKVHEINYMAMKKYTPKSFPGKVTIFKPTEKEIELSQAHDYGWSEYAAGGVDVYEMPGNHVSMIEEPHVQVLSKKLNDCIDDVLGG